MSWNAFKLCTALRALGYIMVLVVVGIVGLTYYAVVLGNYLPALLQGGLGALLAFPLLILFHFLVIPNHPEYSFYFLFVKFKFLAVNSYKSAIKLKAIAFDYVKESKIRRKCKG